MKQFTLPKTERLYLRESIGELFANGRTFMVFPYRVVYLIRKDDADDQPAPAKQARCAIMAVAPKKRFKHAVARNHVKRLTREAYRLQKLPLLDTLRQNGLAMEVAFLYVDNKFISFDETCRLMGKALGRLQRFVRAETKRNDEAPNRKQS